MDVPAGGATVEVQDSTGRMWTALADGDGCADFADLPPGPFIVACRKGNASESWNHTFYSPDFLAAGVVREERVCLREDLLRYGSVVADEDGSPVPDAVVEAWEYRWVGYRSQYWFETRLGPWPIGVVLSGEPGLLPPSGARRAVTLGARDGSFGLPLPERQEFVVVARAPGRAPAGVQVSGTEEGPLEIRLIASGSFHGVVRGPDGEPVPGAVVIAFPADAEDFAWAPVERAGYWNPPSDPAVVGTRADAAGRYVLEGVGAGTARLLVADRPGVGRSVPVADAWIPSAGISVERDLVLRRWPRVRVLWEGVPPAGYEKFAAGIARAGGGDRGWTALDPDGRGGFAGEGIPPGRWRVRAEGVNPTTGCCPGYDQTPLGSAVFEATEEMEEVTVVLGPPEPGPPAKPVAEPAGRGIVRFRLAAVDGGPTPQGVQCDLESVDSSRAMDRWEPVAEEGEFTVKCVPPGTWTLRIHAESFTEVRATVEIEEDGELDLGTLGIDPGRTVRGRLVDLQGHGIPGAELRPPDSGHYRNLQGYLPTDAEGRFVLEHLGPGPVTIDVWAEGFLPGETASLDPGAGGEEAVAVIHRGTLVRGTVRSAAGRPLLGGAEFLPLASADPEEDSWGEGTDVRGRFEIRLATGSYSMRFRGGGEPVPLGPLEAEEGAVLDLDLVVPDSPGEVDAQ